MSIANPVFFDGTNLKSKGGELEDLTNITRTETPISFGTATDKTTFESDGTMVAEGAATVWADIDFSILIRTTGPNIPTLTAFNGNLTMPQWEINDLNMCESQEFIHEWKEGSECFWHIHLSTGAEDATDRYVRFELEYGYSVGGNMAAWTFPATITTDDLLIPADTPAKTQMILSLGSFTPTGAKIGDHALARLRRIATSNTTNFPAPSVDPWIPMLQMHVEKDTLGSRQMTTK